MTPGRCIVRSRSSPCQLFCIVCNVPLCSLAVLALSTPLSSSFAVCPDRVRGLEDFTYVSPEARGLSGSVPKIHTTGTPVGLGQSLGEKGRAKACRLCITMSRFWREDLGAQACGAGSANLLASLPWHSASSVGRSSLLEELDSVQKSGSSPRAYPPSCFWRVPRKGAAIPISSTTVVLPWSHAASGLLRFASTRRVDTTPSGGPPVYGEGTKACGCSNCHSRSLKIVEPWVGPSSRC